VSGDAGEQIDAMAKWPVAWPVGSRPCADHATVLTHASPQLQPRCGRHVERVTVPRSAYCSFIFALPALARSPDSLNRV